MSTQELSETQAVHTGLSYYHNKAQFSRYSFIQVKFSSREIVTRIPLRTVTIFKILYLWHQMQLHSPIQL